MEDKNPFTSTTQEDRNPFLASGNTSEVPSSIKNAQQHLGNDDYNGLCETFVEHMTGAPNMGPTAAQAWNNYAQNKKAYQGTTGIQPGNPVYFTPDSSNDGNGHTGIYLGNNQFIAATDNGVKQYDLNDWQQMTGQQLLGYVKQ